MTTVYVSPVKGGRKLSTFIAHYGPVQKHLTSEARKMAGTASGLLSAHRYDGDARIQMSSDGRDRYVWLNDDRGLSAAMSIEFGRKANSEGKGGMAGLYILHDATGAIYSGTKPQSMR